MRHIWAIAAATLASVPGVASAAPFVNGSFEDSVAPLAGFASYGAGTNIGGWVVSQGQIDVVGANFLAPDFVASDGVYSVDMNGSNGTRGGVAQTFDTVANTSYRVTFDLNANVYDNFVGIKNVEASAGDFTGVFGYDTSLHTQGQPSPWTSFSFNFTASSASTTLAFESFFPNATGPGSNFGALLDNVNVTVAAVPEPTTWAMMILGMAGVGISMRRRKATLRFA